MPACQRAGLSGEILISETERLLKSSTKIGDKRGKSKRAKNVNLSSAT